MDRVHCSWNRTSGKHPSLKPRPIADTLSRLAELMARVEQKKERHSLKSQPASPYKSKDCDQECLELNSFACHQQREHALHKPHHCHQCGQMFALASTLQLHRCLNSSLVCQVCREKHQWDSPCLSCLGEASGPRNSEEQPQKIPHKLHHDTSLYACAPCGRAFSHKQELLYHQQAGVCQPHSPKTFTPPSAVLLNSLVDAPMSSCASLLLSPSVTNENSITCSNCLKTFRTVQGLSCHQRLVHPSSWTKKKKTSHTELKGMLFPCRSCDKVFSQTATLYLHRKEEHRRNTLCMKQQRSFRKTTRQMQKGETYPCLHCGKVFLHHLTRWAHFRSYSTHYQTHIAHKGKSRKMHKAGNEVNHLKTTRCKCKHASPSKEFKLINNNKKVKKHTPFSTSMQEISDRKDAEIPDEDGEFPCPSCEQVFKTQCGLRQHEGIHQVPNTTKHCSVCTGQIELPVTLFSLNKVYHCVPCREAFVDLKEFLQHCNTHLTYSDCIEKDDVHFSEN